MPHRKTCQKISSFEACYKCCYKVEKNLSPIFTRLVVTPYDRKSEGDSSFKEAFM